MSSNSALDERTLREIYLTAFEIAIKESSPSSVMAAYNLINGEYCPENKMLLTDILREEWGFDGLVMSDWTAINNRSESLKAGCDLLMPGCHYYAEKAVAKDVKEGKLKKEVIRQAANRVKAWVRKFGPDGEMYKLRPESCNYDHHNTIAQKAAEESAVLLKNADNILPIRPSQTVSALGRMYTKLRYQGAGSSLINPTKLRQISEVIKSDGSAADCDITVIFTGLPDEYESEGFDRSDLKLPPEDVKLIEETAAVNPNTVVVLFAGGVVETPWIDKVKAVLYMGLPGQAGAEAVKNLLYGYANPSGRLAETWCMEYADTPSADTYGAKNATYKEGIYVGYRYYEKNAKTVRFPFGHGLSYTEFEYSKLTITDETVSVRVKNIGSRVGGDAVLMYVVAPEDSAVDRPVRELKGFTKVFLEPNAETTVKFKLEPRSFAVWQGKWVIPGGDYKIQIGNLTEEVTVNGDTFAPITYTIPAYDDFPKRPGEFTLNDTPDELAAASLFCKSFCAITEKILLHKAGGVQNNQFEMMYACSVLGPLRATIQAGGISVELAEALVDSANGKHIDSAEHLMDLFVAKLKKS